MTLSLCNQSPISYSYVTLRNQYTSSYALFLSGKIITCCASIVRCANSRISFLWSRKYRAASAVAIWLTAAFHSAFAAFKCFALRLCAANSKSPSVPSDTSNSHSIDGISITVGLPHCALSPEPPRIVLPLRDVSSDALLAKVTNLFGRAAYEGTVA